MTTSDAGTKFAMPGSTELRVERVGWYRDKTHYIVRSAGADGQFGNGDDMVAYLEVSTESIIGGPERGLLRGID